MTHQPQAYVSEGQRWGGGLGRPPVLPLGLGLYGWDCPVSTSRL